MEAGNPLTMFALEPATIHVINPPDGMKYSINNYDDKILITEDIDISVSPGEEVHFYGNGTNGATNIVSTNNVELSGNIMSLVDEENFATITTMEGASFAGLFAGNDYPGGTFIINASGLLLPATELVDRCYASMFYQCGTLQNVTCLATTINGTDCTTDWLNSVNNPGTFTKAKGASCWSSGSNGIPWGWTVNEY